MKKILLGLGILAAMAYANPYKSCITCHGANGEKVASLLQLMEEMEPSKKTDRLLTVAYTFATGKVALGASKGK